MTAEDTQDTEVLLASASCVVRFHYGVSTSLPN